MRWRALIALVAFVACSRSPAESIPSVPKRFALTSSAFAQGDAIPVRLTCDGANRSPPLAWSGAPRDGWLVLVVRDPDAPGGVFVHWVVALPPGTATLAEGNVPAGIVQGRNSLGHDRYDGPCPPSGDAAHHYVFTMFALRGNEAPDLSAFPDEFGDVAIRAEAEAKLTGTYRR